MVAMNIPRSSMVFLAAGMNLACLIVAQLAAQDSAKKPTATEVVDGDAASDKDPKPPETPPAKEAAPAADGVDAPDVAPSPKNMEPATEGAPPVPELAEALPNDDAAVTTELPPPDGVQAPGNPLPNTPEGLAADTATPFSTAAVEATFSSGSEFSASQDADLPADSVPAPADDRGAPWIAAPGGFNSLAANSVGGFPTAPSGFTLGNSGIPVGGVPVSESAFDGFNINATFSGTYTSNATSSPGEPLAPIQDDFIFGLGGSVTYLSKATDWTFGGSYTGKYNQYVELTSYSGYNQALGLVANYDGNRLAATATVNVSYDQGNNRYYSSEFVQQTNYNFNLNARYRISSKTSLQGNVGQGFSTTSQSSFDDTESFNLGLAGLWRYSKLTEFGPGIRYTYLTGGNRDNRSSIGPELLVNYKLGSKVNMNTRVGIDFAQYGNGQSADPTLAGSVGLTYNASRLWSMNLALFSGNQADASTADVFTQVNSIRLGVSRRIRRATVNLGVSYEINSYQNSGVNSAADRPDQNYFSVSSSMGMAIISNTYYASVFLQYSDQSGSASETWDAVQSGFSISRSF